jgi:hypothetical protein
MASCNTLLQDVAPAHLRGRVMSLYAFVFAGVAPVGSFMMGSLAQGFGVLAAYKVGGGLGLAGVLALAWVWARSDGRASVNAQSRPAPLGAAS